MKQLIQFLRESREELQKVTWPTRDEITSYTVVVIVTIVVLSLFLWLVDTALMSLIKVVMK